MPNKKTVIWILVGIVAVAITTWVVRHFIQSASLLAIGTFSILGFSFLWVFNHEKKQWWFWYSYSFMVLALLLSVVPFILGEETFGRDRHRLEQGPSGEHESAHSAPISILRGCANADDAPSAVRCSVPPARVREQWVVNIGGLVGPVAHAPKSHRIQDGLVVPLYFIVLALVGGAISMTRRIPEYQKRSHETFSPTPEESFLDNPTLREFLVFQIVQFVSAPLLAIVAFHLFDLETLATLVPLGFIVGFSSETILMMIRAVVTKLKPAGASPAALGSIWGTAMDSSGPLSGVQVSLLGKPPIVATTATDGSYVLEDVPAGKRSVKFTGTSQTKVKNVEVVASTAVECNVKL